LPRWSAYPCSSPTTARSAPTGWFALDLNVQPVVSIGLNAGWNLTSRTIVPLVSQDPVCSGVGRQSGLGDVVQSVFLLPKAPTPGGWVWDGGPGGAPAGFGFRFVLTLLFVK